MSELWQAVSCRLGDGLLGWLLCLPRDVSLLLLALLSALLVLGLRRLVTDPPLLRAIRQDQRRLKELIRQARASREKASRDRYRRTAGAVAALRVRQEFRALLVSLLPLALLVTWASHRLHYFPTGHQEPVELVAWLPSSAVGSVLHLVPEAGLESPDGWVREIAPSRLEGSPRGTASWVLRAAARDEVYRLTLRFRDRSIEHPARVGQTFYEAPRCAHGDDVETQLKLREYRPLGIVAGVWFPPWLVGYVVLVLLAYYVGNRTLRIV